MTPLMIVSDCPPKSELVCMIGITFAGWLVDNIGFEPAIIGFGMLLAVLGLFLSRRLGPAG